MKTRLYSLLTIVVVSVFASCGSGSGTASGTDSVKSDTSTVPAMTDTTMKADTSMHQKTDTSSMPK